MHRSGWTETNWRSNDARYDARRAAMNNDTLFLRVQSAVPVSVWPDLRSQRCHFMLTQLSKIVDLPIIVASPQNPPEHGLVV